MSFIDVEGSVRQAFEVVWSALGNIITGDDTGEILKKLVASSSIFERNVLKSHLARGIVGGFDDYRILPGGSTYNVELGHRYFYNLNASEISSSTWTLNLGTLTNPSSLEAYTQESVGGTIEVLVYCNVANGQTLRVVDGNGIKANYNMSQKGYYLLTAWATQFISRSSLGFECFITRPEYLG